MCTQMIHLGLSPMGKNGGDGVTNRCTFTGWAPIVCTEIRFAVWIANINEPAKEELWPKNGNFYETCSQQMITT